MSLPFELTTFPSQALDIIRYLAGQDNYAAYDGEIIEALGLSDRSFGKAIRRLVTKEYVEMQYDGSYVLTRQGTEAAEALAAHDEEVMAESVFEEDAAPEPAAELETASRSAIVVYPRQIPAGQAVYVFFRVDVPAEKMSKAVDAIIEVSADCEVTPSRHEITIPADRAADAQRFSVSAPRAGHYTLQFSVLQSGNLDMLDAGQFRLRLSAVDDPADAPFRADTFELTFMPEL